MRKRSHNIYIRMNDDEYARFLSKVEEAGVSQQAYALEASLNAKVSSADDRIGLLNMSKTLADMDKQLRGLGTNVNQMAHVANGNGALPTEDELRRIGADISMIKAKVNDVWRSTRQSINQQNPMEQ